MEMLQNPLMSEKCAIENSFTFWTKSCICGPGPWRPCLLVSKQNW